jgi:hypothetical protein
MVFAVALQQPELQSCCLSSVQDIKNLRGHAPISCQKRDMCYQVLSNEP